MDPLVLEGLKEDMLELARRWREMGHDEVHLECAEELEQLVEDYGGVEC